MWFWLLLAASAPQEVRVMVATATAGPGVTLLVRTTWLGEERTLVLTDDGSQPGDTPADGVYAGVWTGEAVRMLPISIVQRDSAGEILLYEGLERVYQPADTLSFALTATDPPVAERVVAPYVARRVELRETALVAASIGWAVLVFGYVAWLVGRAFPPRAA